jgi:hypothetical protein
VLFNIVKLHLSCREMVWKPGQSGNIQGRPRAAYHWDGEKIVEHDTTQHRAYRAAMAQGRGKTIGTTAKRDEYKYSAEELHLEDPILFQHKLLGNESLPVGLRVAIAQNIAPYCHPRIGLVSMARYIETPIEVPDIQTIEAEAFLLSLSRRVGAGELDIDSASEVTAQITAWVHSRHARAELELKQLAASADPNPTIRIEGGLPDLPGTSIIMPAPEGPVIEGPSALGQDPTLPKPEPTDAT